MKASEIIKILENLKSKHGDKEVHIKIYGVEEYVPIRKGQIFYSEIKTFIKERKLGQIHIGVHADYVKMKLKETDYYENYHWQNN